MGRPQAPKEARGATIRYAASTGVGLHIGAYRGWKPEAWDLRPLHGFEVPVGSRAAVVVGVAGNRAGTIFIHAFAIEYRIGGRRYEAVYPVGVKACVGKAICPQSPT